MKYERIPISKIVHKYGIAGVHPYADLMPLIEDDEFANLCEDIERDGFLHPIRVNDAGLLIDGRNRLQVAWAIGKDPAIERFNPPDILAYVISENIRRRHLTRGQRADIGEQIANLKHGTNQYEQKMDVPNGISIGREQAADMVGSSVKDISMMRLIKEYAPQAAKIVAVGNMTLEEAYRHANRKKKEVELVEKPEKPKDPEIISLQGIIDKKIVEIPYPKTKNKHQFNHTNEAVDWASWTWNPVTGCLHGCAYCYAREMAYRDSYKAAYPIQFAPLFHHERLDDPINTKPGTDRPQDGRVFVCSMADLFGEWVPQAWIDAVFDATLKAPEWEYLFLTKFPQRYRRINLPPKAWFGASVDIQKRVKVTEKFMANLDVAVRWISVEPMLEPIKFTDLSWCDLLIIGAQSETHQPDGFVSAYAPKFEWVIDLIDQARAFKVPIYLKPNLLGEINGSKPGMILPQEQPRYRK